MKKFITLALAFVMVLGLTVPALAFTTKEPEEEVAVPYEISIKMVEVSEDDFGMLFSLPPSDRGYAKNEVVTAVATLLSPKGNQLFTDDGYQEFRLGGENVKLYVNSGYLWSGFTGFSEYYIYWNAAAVRDVGFNTDDEIFFDFTGRDSGYWDQAPKFTFAVAFSGKVTDDEALLYAKLTKNTNFDANGELIIGDFKIVATKTNVYEVWSKDGLTQYFDIHTGKGDRSTRMVVYEGTPAVPYEVYVDVNGNIAFAVARASAVVDENNPLTFHTAIEADHPSRNVRNQYKKVKAVYDDIVVDEFGFDFFLRGNIVKKSTFTGIANADDLYVEVAIEPWYAYVEVPPAIQVDPPKTGDAMSIVGFVMIALAGLAVVAVKKVRA